MLRSKALFILLILWTSCVFANATHKVVAVIDGDTIKVLNGQKEEKIRLAKIDAPEMGQAHGQKAKQAFCVVSTGEASLYGSVILTKGVLGPSVVHQINV